MFEPIKQTEPEKKSISLNDIEKFRVRHTDNVPKPDVVLSINGKIISTRKNIFGITGKAKVGKSFLMTLLNTAVLRKGEYGVISSYLPKGKDKIIYIDTEQSDYHVSIALQRINTMIENNKIENLLMYAFDAVKTDDRYAFTEWLISNTQGVGLVIIDGIADLVKTVNDEIIAVDMADTLRRWATIHDIAIGYVLHQNPSDNSKMRGHLGTVLMNKSETVIQIASAEENESIKLVSTTQTRNAKPEDWSFEIIEGIPTIMDECYQVPKSGRKPNIILTDIDRYTILNQIFAGNKASGMPYTILFENIKEIYIDKYGQIGDTKIKDFVRYCKDKDWLQMPDGPKTNYHLYPFK